LSGYLRWRRADLTAWMIDNSTAVEVKGVEGPVNTGIIADE
jgi:hypothetical protein